MQRAIGAVAGTVLSLALCGPAAAQQKIEWNQTISPPKGLNMPQGVMADILGIEVGDAYADAKAKIRKLADEGYKQPPRKMSDAQKYSAEITGERNPDPEISESTITFNFRNSTAGNVTVQGSYVGQIAMRRELPGSTKENLTEMINLKLGAPSSGHQVLGLTRQIVYPTQGDQPRISEILSSLKAKFQTDFYLADRINNIYRAQFDNAKSVVPTGDPLMACQPQYQVTDQAAALKINPTGQCDVLMQVAFNIGISKDHASSVIFTLSDNERTKADLAADFAFVESYVRNLQNSSGVAPKL